VAVVLTLVQTKQVRINIHKRNNTKTQYKRYNAQWLQVHLLTKHPDARSAKHQNSLNCQKTPTYTHTHYKTHTYTHPHITKPTHTLTHTLQNPHIHTPTDTLTHTSLNPHTHNHTLQNKLKQPQYKIRTK